MTVLPVPAPPRAITRGLVANLANGAPNHPSNIRGDYGVPDDGVPDLGHGRFQELEQLGRGRADLRERRLVEPAPLPILPMLRRVSACGREAPASCELLQQLPVPGD